MIRINLLGEQKDRSAAYALHAIALILLLFVFGISYLWIAGALYSEINILENDIALKESLLSKLKKETKKVQNMEENQKLLIEKLEIIAKLKTRKQGPVRILNDISNYIPEPAWLTSISQKDDILELSGVAVDGQTVSDFIGRVRESRFIEDADAVKTQMVMRDDVKLQSFTFPASLSNLLTLKPKLNESGKDKKNSKPKKRRK